MKPPSPQIAETNDVSHRRHRSLFQEAEEFPVQSHLIFLYADLRLLSAAGRLHTKFETLFVESDKVQRILASDLSGTSETIESDHLLGISPAQIMAILIIEIRKEVQKNKQEKERIDTEKSFLSILSDSSSRKHSEDDMASRLHFYNRMIGKDLKKKIDAKNVLTGTSQKASTKSLCRIDTSTDPDRLMLAPPKPTRRLSTFFNKNKDDHRFILAPPKPKRRSSTILRRSSTFFNKNSKLNIFSDENSNKEESQPTRRSSQLTSQRFSISLQEAQIVGDAFFNLAKEGVVQDVDKTMTEDEFLDMIQTAVDSRENHSLDFMSKFFKADSICEAMFKSTANIFWINDWYPLIDCTYAIAVDPCEKRVLVVFRGTATTTDWEQSNLTEFVKVPNPIKDLYEGKKDTISFHSGFYNYLFYKRKDTGTTKFDEIANKVHEFVTTLGKDCEIVITGFSLGGALATIFGFYGSADRRLTMTGPIKMYTYASPYVGGPSFAVSFQRQERENKIRYARVFNSDDSVPHLPVSFKGNFQHVGLKVDLPRLRGYFRKQLFGQPCPKPYYSKNYDFAPRYYRALQENFFINLTFPWKIMKSHTLNEHHKRIIFFRENYSEFFNMNESSIEDLYQKIVLCDS
uniref:Fungal lipase-type domain-containing protein n=1 Tax=Eucampia antarctica TaxID=49252 RepID=A0A7S2RIA2_9STRA|mmetsp:Transcript_22559/g.21685  ORF Transcript_22559/g.21685 Transcript_22559/m.21685 type:complete len:630 (+) Transcript_22559:59-1948(+)